MKKITTILIEIILGIVLILGIGYAAYQYNWFGIHGQVVKEIQSHKTTVDTTPIKKNSDRQAIMRRLMRDTQPGLQKQGFVSVPQVGILEPIFDDAYLKKGLNAGANYANRTQNDPQGTQAPVMGQGNYGLASHNFDDGLTGFSGLQQHYQDDAPYLVAGKRHENKWLNNKSIYLANASGIYEYRIARQKVVTADNVSVLNTTNRAQVTIITCLFPSTQFRIITTGYLTKTYTWGKAPSRVVHYFDLTKQPTNAHADWFNPGIEEGSNGDAGGTKVK